MGIRMSLAETKSDAGAFSQDILKIEVTGPEQIHLTVIDVPGIFRVLVPGLTTETDIRMVEEMVKDYIRNPRTIILAVIPCNVDIATQEVLKLAKTADPQGTRTMAVLTKPDLATEQATQNAIMELVLEERNKLRLGYLVVKNRSADDHSSTTQARTASENAFFSADPWSRAAGRCGVHALTNRLRILLMNLSKKEIPAVKAEIVTRLRRNKNDLQAMGPSRADEYSQRQYLGEIAMNFQDITKAALSGEYSGRKLFKTEEELRLITRIMRLQKGFANIFRQRAHTDHFVEDYEAALHEPISEVEGEFTDQGLEQNRYPDIQDIITDEDFICPIASNTPIIERVREVFDAYRGPDLGTNAGTADDVHLNNIRLRFRRMNSGVRLRPSIGNMRRNVRGCEPQDYELKRPALRCINELRCPVSPVPRTPPSRKRVTEQQPEGLLTPPPTRPDRHRKRPRLSQETAALQRESLEAILRYHELRFRDKEKESVTRSWCKEIPLALQEAGPVRAHHDPLEDAPGSLLTAGHDGAPEVHRMFPAGDDAEARVCHECSAALKKGRLPKACAVNNMHIGCEHRYPEELDGLSPLEERLIALQVPFGYITKFTVDNKTPSGLSYRKHVKGHIVVFPNKNIHVSWSGSSKPGAADVGHLLQVRKSRVRAALTWLQKNNPLYEHITIDHGEIDGWQYADGSHVPIPVMASMQREEPSVAEKAQTDHIVPDTDRGLEENRFTSIEEIVASAQAQADHNSNLPTMALCRAN
ncbi:Pol [Purpureocillium lavendulum]|uniref:Pol n=1 Tax=Purpureocillium lavendulum TaxID=1247861 RepID=A0AB34FC86_9HYPO|nr:Pol [Purpureocillium lavendulum]